LEAGIVRDLVLCHGWNAVAYQILNPGFNHWISPEGDAVAGYVKRAGRWVIAGAPVCSPQALPRVIKELEPAAHAAGCKVCYFGAAVRLYDGCRHPPRHSVVYLGAQPVWNPAGWQRIIATKASLRAQINRALNKGVEVREWTNVSSAETEALRSVLKAWLKSRPMPPMHFLVEPDTLGMLQDRRILVAMRYDKPCGFLVASPVPARNGWLIEQIIRHPDAPNGTNELLLHKIMTVFHQEKSSYVTLGLVPLSSHKPVDGPANPFWLEFLFKWVRAHGKRFYNFQGLEVFKSKFCPDDWEPIYAISTEKRFSMRSLWAIAAAFSHHRSPLVHGIQTLWKSARIEGMRMKEHNSKRK